MLRLVSINSQDLDGFVFALKHVFKAKIIHFLDNRRSKFILFVRMTKIMSGGRNCKINFVLSIYSPFNLGRHSALPT